MLTWCFLQSQSRACNTGRLRSRCRSGGEVDNGEDDDSDDGVELAPERGNNESESQEKAGQDHRHEDESRAALEGDEKRGEQQGVEIQDEAQQDKTRDEHREDDVRHDLQGESTQEGSTEKNSQSEKDKQIEEGHGELQDGDREGQAHLTGNESQHPQQLSPKLYTTEQIENKIEVGLTLPRPEIISWLRINSEVLARKEADVAFDMCQKLDVDVLLPDLIQFLKDRQAEKENPQLWGCEPSTFDTNDPDKMFRGLGKVIGHGKTIKIYRAYGQMKLFSLIDQQARSRGLTSHKLILNEYHQQTNSQVSAKRKTAKKRTFHDEYTGGAKWHAVASWFGGPAIVMVFIVAG